MGSAHQLALIDHRRNDEFWATKYLVVEVIAREFPGTIGGDWNRHYGVNLFGSALAQNARDEAEEGTYSYFKFAICQIVEDLAELEIPFLSSDAM